MKRILILITIFMVAGSLFAREAILIDFSLLAADDGRQNSRTLMDFAHVAGASFTEPQREAMRTSLAIENWEVILASSARHVTNMVHSFTREAPSRQYGTVMGVRVHFPLEPHNSWAKIRPPFEIPAFEPFPDGNGNGRRSRFESDEDSADSPAFGVVHNVAVIREIQTRVYGLNFPHRLSVLLLDSFGNERSFDMGNLQFDGWGYRRWVNPAYIQEVRNRDLRLFPLYPTTTPFIKFNGFLIQRDAQHIGGDFITYFKDVRIIYDQATLDMDRDIDNEAIWGIIETRETQRRNWEMQRFGHNQVLRFLEQERQSTELPFGHPDRQQQ